MRLEIATSGPVNQHTNTLPTQYRFEVLLPIYNPNPNHEEQGAASDPVQSQVQPKVQYSFQLTLGCSLTTQCCLVIHCINLWYNVLHLNFEWCHNGCIYCNEDRKDFKYITDETGTGGLLDIRTSEAQGLQA